MLETRLALKAPQRLQHHPADTDLVYRSLYQAITGRRDEVDWGRFGEGEWRLLMRMAHPDAEGVGPLLYREYRDTGWPEAMPAVVRERLRRYYYNTLANNTVRFSELKRILAAFDRAGIPVVLLKGAALAPLVYEDIGLRPMGDLDLLIRPEHVRQAFHVLASTGYHLYKTTVQSLFVNRSKIPVMIELHWGIIVRGKSGRLPDMDWFWERTQASGHPRLGRALSLTPCAHLLFLIAHQYLQHEALIDRLLWLRDMELLLHQQPDAIEMLERDPVVAAFGWEAGLEGFKSRMGPGSDLAPQFPAGCPESGRQPGSVRVVQDPDEDVVRIFYSLSVLGWPMRLYLMLKILVPPEAYLRTRYTIKSKMLVPLYYVVRWFSLVRRAIF